MEQHVERALENHHKGYNCAQAVACAYAELAGVDEETLFKMTEGFGFGMGDGKDVCGAITGAVTLAGFINSDGPVEKPGSKKKTYELARCIKQAFSEKNQTVYCHELKGIETGKVLRSCDGCIADAAEIANRMLFRE